MANTTSPSTKKTSKSDSPVSAVLSIDEQLAAAQAQEQLPDFDTWTEAQIGFAPYWRPAAGSFFYATPVARDERDPDFVRYLFVAKNTIKCRRGPKDETGEDVLVRPGESFSMNVYKQVADEFDFYMESGVFPAAYVKAVETRISKKTGNEYWTFKVKVEPSEMKQINTLRAQRSAELAERAGVPAAATKGRPALEA